MTPYRPAYLPLLATLCIAPFFPLSTASAQSRMGGAAPQSAPTPKPPIPAMEDPVSAPSRRAECAWTGQRIVSLLWRDDVNTAREQARFYEMFDCPGQHLPLAFRCVIQKSESEPEQADLTARVYSCWMNPEETNTQQ